MKGEKHFLMIDFKKLINVVTVKETVLKIITRISYFLFLIFHTKSDV